MLLSILKLLFVSLHTAVIAPVVVAVAIRDERAAYRVCQRWARVNLRVCGVRVHVRRLAVLDPARPYVFMSNHRSQFDILAAVEALSEFQLRWVAKKELTRVPFFGWALKHAGHVIVDRSDHEQAVASLRAVREKMEGGISVMIFPEGTRARPDQELLPLKKGGFMLALETGFPVVPLAIRGSAVVLPRNSRRIRAGHIDVVVGVPIPVAGVARDELMERVEVFLREQLRAPAEVHRARAAVG